MTASDAAASGAMNAVGKSPGTGDIKLAVALKAKMKLSRAQSSRLAFSNRGVQVISYLISALRLGVGLRPRELPRKAEV